MKQHAIYLCLSKRHRLYFYAGYSRMWAWSLRYHFSRFFDSPEAWHRILRIGPFMFDLERVPEQVFVK